MPLSYDAMIILPAAISTSKVTCSASSQLGQEGIADSSCFKKRWGCGLGAGEVIASITAAKTRPFSEWPVGPHVTTYSFARSLGGLLQLPNADNHPGQRWVGMCSPTVPRQQDSG